IELPRRFIRHLAHVAAGVTLIIAFYAIYIINPAMLRAMGPTPFLAGLKDQFRACLHLRKYHQALQEAVAAQKQQYNLADLKTTIGASAVDVFGQSQSLAILNDLNYRPRPAFQSFESYTPYLIRRNYEHYLKTPPDFVLLQFGTVDGRYIPQDDSLTLAWLL